MIDETRIRKIQITDGSLLNNYFNVGAILDFFPSDSVGGSNSSSLGESIHVLTDNGLNFETDIARDKRVFRKRGAVGDFYKGRFVDGDSVYIYRIDSRSYFIAKTIESIEARYSDNAAAEARTDLKRNNKDLITQLLSIKKQIILYGPPGTGKTFSTKNYAVKLIAFSA